MLEAGCGDRLPIILNILEVEAGGSPVSGQFSKVKEIISKTRYKKKGRDWAYQ
jgi:hypothetical protein